MEAPRYRTISVEAALRIALASEQFASAHRELAHAQRADMDAMRAAQALMREHGLDPETETVIIDPGARYPVGTIIMATGDAVPLPEPAAVP